MVKVLCRPKQKLDGVHREGRVKRSGKSQVRKDRLVHTGAGPGGGRRGILGRWHSRS